MFMGLTGVFLCAYVVFVLCEQVGDAAVVLQRYALVDSLLVLDPLLAAYARKLVQ